MKSRAEAGNVSNEGMDPKRMSMANVSQRCASISQPTLRALALIVSISAPAAAQSRAQPVEKRTLSVDDYANWNSIRGATLSPDGRYVAYSMAPGLGDGEIVVKSIDDGRVHRYGRGFIGRQQLQPGDLSNPQFPDAEFVAGGRDVVFTIEPTRAEVERAPTSANSGSGPHQFTLGLMNVRTGDVRLVPGVTRYRIPRDNRSRILYGKYSGATSRASTLVLRDLTADHEDSIATVAQFDIDDSAHTIAFSVDDSTASGVFVRTTTMGTPVRIDARAALPNTLRVSSDGRLVAFFARDTVSGRGQAAAVGVVIVDVATRSARAIALPESARDRFTLNAQAGLRFAVDGRLLMFSAIGPKTVDQDGARVELWTWRDPLIEPSSRAARPAITLAYDVMRQHLSVLGDDSLPSPSVTLAQHAPVVLMSSDARYKREALSRGSYRDYDVVDLITGVRRRLATRVPPYAVISPDGTVALYFGQDNNWYAMEIATGRVRNLTANVGPHFEQETWSYPTDAAPWGTAAWADDGASVLFYDRYDIWQFDLRGTAAPRVLTDSAGRRAKRVYRIAAPVGATVRLHDGDPLTLRSVNDETKETGFWRARVGRRAPPDSLLGVAKTLGVPVRAANADTWLFTEETFTESPDLWVAGKDFAAARRVSDINPQQAQFRWGTTELVSWRDPSGATVRGVLYKPEGFDSTKTYPLVVYVYERLSQHRFAYKPPEPTAEINRTVYVSNGYLVFEPDIQYEIGQPGPSALRSVEGGVRTLTAHGFVDSAAVAIQGISWGGYEAAYVAAHSKLFKAAVLASPITDVVSDYGAYALDIPFPRLAGWEYLQGRIGASLWERPDLYIANSPIMAADQMTMPTLIMANDGDGTVPWAQGVELYTALRRLDREVYLLNYRGDQHQPGSLDNRLDIAHRTQQFLDHHLRRLPAPSWMLVVP